MMIMFGAASLHAPSAVGDDQLTAKQQSKTDGAWEAFRRADYEDARRQAKACIDEHFPTALASEKKLRIEKAVVPKDVVSEAEKRQIFQNGPLNDVAACYYIFGRASEYLGARQDAKAALTQASRFTYGRCWDSKTATFWSVAEAAAGRLLVMETLERQRSQLPPDKEVNHESFTAFAWAAFNRGDDAGAIIFADRCLTNYSVTAWRLQRQLEQERPTLPTGRWFTRADKLRIDKNGPLNDVGTCLFIKGRSLQKLGRKAEAKAAYEAAGKYTYSRCWDPAKGLYWSPAEGASDWLDIIGLPSPSY
jgi:tetratricopeptide (TPR) repeat protein